MNLLIAADFPSRQLPPIRLFPDSQGTAGVIILAVFVGGLLTWFGFALMGYFRAKRLEKLPPVIGDPHVLLDQVGALIGLGIVDRYLLSKVAARMTLVQPVSLLLSPILLVEAARVWERSHHFASVRKWGCSRFDTIARRLFGKSIHDLKTPK